MADLDGFSLHVLPLKGERDELLMAGAYKLWRDVWEKTFLELEGRSDLTSDDFSRQDEIVVLAHFGRPVGLVFHRYVDASLPMTMEDSYFRCWTVEAKVRIQSEGPRLVIGSNITLLPEYRKSVLRNFSVKRLLSLASLEHLSRQDGICAITGTMRADKGMHSLFYECGAYCLEKNVRFHNVPVDLVGFFPKLRPIHIPAPDMILIQELKNNAQQKGRKNENQRAA